MAIDILQGLSALSLTVLVTLEALQVPHDYTMLLATLSAVFMGGSMGPNKWIVVSRGQLVQTLERVIQRDPEALKMLAEKRKAGASVNKLT